MRQDKPKALKDKGARRVSIDTQESDVQAFLMRQSIDKIRTDVIGYAIRQA